MVKELNSGPARTYPDRSRVGDLNQGLPYFKSSTLNHSTMLGSLQVHVAWLRWPVFNMITLYCLVELKNPWNLESGLCHRHTTPLACDIITHLAFRIPCVDVFSFSIKWCHNVLFRLHKHTQINKSILFQKLVFTFCEVHILQNLCQHCLDLYTCKFIWP